MAGKSYRSKGAPQTNDELAEEENQKEQLNRLRNGRVFQAVSYELPDIVLKDQHSHGRAQ